MTINVTATAAEAAILAIFALLHDVADVEEIEITKRENVVARLVPAEAAHAFRDAIAGVAMTVDPEDDLVSTGAVWVLGRHPYSSTPTPSAGGRLTQTG